MKRKSSTRTLMLVISASATIMGCQGHATPEKQATNQYVPVPPVTARQNPGAKLSYDLTLEFAGLPGALNPLSGHADFAVSNRDCIPMDYTRALGGVKLLPEHRLPINWLRINETTYTATIKLDALLDENYYGLGLCRWAFQSANVQFTSPTTQFVSGMIADAVRNESRMVQHYLARDFFDKPTPGDFVFGESRADFYLAKLGPQFTLTISARKSAR